MTFGWDSDVGDFDVPCVSFDRGTVRVLTVVPDKPRRYSLLVTRPENALQRHEVTVREVAVRSVVAGPNLWTDVGLPFSTAAPTAANGRVGEVTVMSGLPTLSLDHPSRNDGDVTDARLREVGHGAFVSVADRRGPGLRRAESAQPDSGFGGMLFAARLANRWS